jgi:maltoporin
MNQLKVYFISLAFAFLVHDTSGQSNIMYQDIFTADWFSMGFGSYGRIGVNWAGEIGNTQGRRLNLNNMGSIGGRLEEQDYLELGMAFHMRPVTTRYDSLEINVQFRTSVFSRSAASFGNSNTESLGGLTIALPEMYVEARNLFDLPLNVWVGSRLYRGPDVHMADYFYFNDHSGQGFGVEYNRSRFSVNFVASTDTTSTVPPYFYLNIKSGTSSLEIRERVVYTFEHDFHMSRNMLLSGMLEYHSMSNPSSDQGDTTNLLLSFPSDFGWVVGARIQWNKIGNLRPGSFNQLGVRYGSRIANGGDGGSTRTWETFGAVDTTTFKFTDAYSWHIVDHFLLNISPKFSLNGYVIYNKSRGAAETKGLSESYLGREVFNSKEDLSIGGMGMIYLTDIFHLRPELHYSQRRDGDQDWYNMIKFSLAPTLAVRGERSVWSRPHIRLIYSVARYNDFARDNVYSSYLQIAGPKSWGHFFGVRAEWWTW